MAIGRLAAELLARNFIGAAAGAMEEPYVHPQYRPAILVFWMVACLESGWQLPSLYMRTMQKRCSVQN